MPSLAIKDGLVVTPSNTPKSYASLISFRLAVSIKNLIYVRVFFSGMKRLARCLLYGTVHAGLGGNKKGKPTSHRYNRLPLLPSGPGGFSRSWSCRFAGCKVRKMLVL